MEQQTQEKMESLQKYVPFIDFVLKIDGKKYTKFTHIRKWIVLRKTKYPATALNKIEQSIITQYKNLLIENNVQIPENISNIFAPLYFKEYVNLCSDEEEDEAQEVNKKKEDNNRTTGKPSASKERRKTNDEKYSKTTKVEDSDDDLEIVSIDYVNKVEKKVDTNSSSKSNILPDKVIVKGDADLDEISYDILCRIDKIAEDDIKMKSLVHEPINYTYQEKDFRDISENNSEPAEEKIFERRTTSDVLFKRRTDFQDEVIDVTDLENNQNTMEMANFKDDEVEVQSIENNNKKFCAKKTIEIISLDSCSDGEFCSDDERPTTSKAAAIKAARNKEAVDEEVTIVKVDDNISEERNSNSNKKVEFLCNSIDSVSLDMNELMEELNDCNETSDATPTKTTTIVLEKQTSDGSSDKENSIQPTDTNKTQNLNQDQICKLLEDISNNKDFDMDTFYAALSYVKQMNTTSSKTNPLENNSQLQTPTETPPPAPPPISNNLPTPPAHHIQHEQSPQYPQNVYYPAQHSQYIAPPLAPHYTQNGNFVNMPGTAPPPRPKVNINDPRIIKQLQAIQNSPLFTYNVLNSETAASIMQICQSQKFQQPQQRANFQNSSKHPHNNNNMASANNTATTSNHFRKTTDAAASSSSNSITYGEYKRRQQEQKLQLERQREQERKAKLEREKQELLKKKNEEIRSQMLSTLTPCQDQLTTMWSQQKNLPKNSGVGGNKTTNVEQEKQNATTATVENNVDGKEKKSKTITIKKVYTQTKFSNNNNTKMADTTQSKANNVDQKLNRVYSELKCTFKGFDQLHDYIPTVDQNSFRKSNEKRQKTTMNGADDSDTNSTHSAEVEVTPRHIGLRRRSSIHALSAISEQLGQQSSDCSDSDTSQKKISSNRNQSTVDPKRLSIDNHNSFSESLSQDFMRSFPKRRKTIDEVIKTTRRAKILRIVDDDSASCSSEDVISSSKESVTLKQPVIKLQRISPEFIRKHTKRRREETDQCSRLKKNCERITNPVEPAQKLSKLKKYNNDCQMTERNTSFCTLCRSKPSDLTNHYIGRHKTESYVSRLDWSELDELSINTPFAKLLPKMKNYRFDRYEIDCPFCKDKLVDQFINLYHHYSAHTGEYAFQCSHCNLTKPYRPDIQSHILHSKTCRNSTINILYRYPPNAQCIYLHYCTICNFVQLNEANVLKHLREHHHSSKAIPSNVQKYILAAMSDGPDANEFNKPPTPTTAAPVQKETTVDRVERTSPPTPPPAVQKETTTADSNSSNSTTTACSSSSNGLELNSVQLPGEELQATTCVLNFKVDDDDIPVTNEPCVEEEFLDDGKYSLEEQLKQLHEGPAPTLNTPPPMTVIHCFGNHLKGSPNAVTNRITQPPPPDRRHLPMIIKTELMELEESLLITPPRPSCSKTQETKPITPPVARNQSGIYEKYRSYPQNVNYLGLYKCMIDDCYYSTDSSEDLCTHLTDHSSVDLKTIESLQCPYCDLPMEMPMSPLQLVEHVGSQHAHLIYQCSMCCYRSCDASNVNVHQQLHHNTAQNSCKIYKCSSDDLQDSNKLKRLDMNDQIVKNIFKLVCTVCNAGFYHTHFLINHLNSEHKVHDADDLKIYSCIYCPLTVANKHEIRMHIATKHPDKLPRVYDHNTQCNSRIEDVIRSSDIVCLSESVAYEEAAKSDSNAENLSLDIVDIKPDLEQLLEMNEETIRARLRKLTAHTGVAPDKLYRCPESTCGGFFSIFDLWLRHMKVRHHSLECQCPHCPALRSLSLEQFSLHFEEHKRHTFICFHCPTTCPNETLAKQHFAEKHAELGGTMRYEQIRFNLCYSYSIMIQSDLCKERNNFIAEFLVTLDSRLKDLESSEIQKLKHQWPVPDNTVWIDDYLPQLYNRKVLRNCLMKDCAFRTLREDSLFHHLRTSHVTEGTKFICSRCKYTIKIHSSFDEIINHIKLHSEFICICAACSLSTSSRSKMCTHITGQHSARDVPVIELFKINQMLFIKIYIVFSDNHLTFSTMKNCFCCPEKNMNGDVFSLHLKRYHKFSFNYYCEKCPSFHFKSLKDVKSHFQQLHPSDKLKVRCELSSPNDLSVISLNEFQVQISIGDQLPLNIKDEPIDVSNTDNDDDVILLEDNDVVIQESLRDDKLQPPKEMPKLKCASLSKLMQPTTSSSTSMQPNCLPMQQVFLQPLTSTSESFPNSTFVTDPYGNNNLGAFINNYTNVSSNHANILSSTPKVNKNVNFYMPQHQHLNPQTIVHIQALQHIPIISSTGEFYEYDSSNNAKL
ncbi:uncharacterized protein LOC135957267 [Calliphora vicina]|uniref:uncharacterized protein LOC135957267 n=1 Tax=Calliphora vicina TaxID=7373 RepID=UPI00325B3F57